MDAFCAVEVEQVTVKKSARLGYTKIIGHVIGYHVHQDPCSMLVVQPTTDDAEGYSKEEVQPTVAETPVLSDLIGGAKSRTSGNTITKKSYPGGILHIVGANSPRGFRRITVRVVLFDECDGYPPTAGQEGDQIKLGTKRTETFWNRKIGLGSTPTNKGESRIGRSFEKSDKGYFVLTCPHCGGEHIRLFRQPESPITVGTRELKVSWMQWTDNDPKTAAWVCPDNGCLIDHGHHYEMVESGYWYGETWEWRREAGFSFADEFTGHIGFSLWAGYSHSPNSTPPKLVREFLDCKTDPDQLKTFVNTVLGQEWEEEGEEANENILMSRREEFAAEVPDGVLILTMGIDVQDDRLELEVVGWDEDQRSWSVDYQVLPGDPTQPYVWEDLADALNKSYRHESSRNMDISGVGIDSGYLNRTVKDFVINFGALYVFPVKGRGGLYPIVEPDKKRKKRAMAQLRKGRVKVELIGVDEAKTVLMRRLKVTEHGPGYCHFPIERGEEYFAQLTAERRITIYKKGRVTYEWKKTRKRNEALDVRVYAHAALLLIEPNWKRLKNTGSVSKVARKSAAKQNASGFGSDEWNI